MSVEVSSWAWKVKGLSPSEKLVLLCLADHSDRDGISWPSQKTIAEKAQVARETVNRAIAKFINLGFLTKEPLGSAYPFNQMYRYCLNCHNPVTTDYETIDDRSRGLLTTDHTEPSERTVKEPSLRGTSFPTDFAVDQAIMDLALKNGWPDPKSEVEAFRDFHIARGARFKDWRAAFRTWLRNAKRFNKRPPAVEPQRSGAIKTGALAELKRLDMERK